MYINVSSYTQINYVCLITDPGLLSTIEGPHGTKNWILPNSLGEKEMQKSAN